MNRSAVLEIVIGEKPFWGKGLGKDAIFALLKHACLTLGLHRVALDVFATNVRGIKCYEKCGFVHEGCQRGAIWKQGKFVDLLRMAIMDKEFAEVLAKEK